MAVNYNIPAGSVIRTQNIVIPSVLNLSTGLYQFNNVLSDFILCEPKSLYLLSSLVVGSNISESAYYNSIVDAPKIEIVRKTMPDEKQQHFPNPIFINTIGQQSILSGYFYAETNDTFQIKTSGSLKQISETIGVEKIDILITAILHRISNQDFIDYTKTKGW